MALGLGWCVGESWTIPPFLYRDWYLRPIPRWQTKNSATKDEIWKVWYRTASLQSFTNVPPTTAGTCLNSNKGSQGTVESSAGMMMHCVTCENLVLDLIATACNSRMTWTRALLLIVSPLPRWILSMTMPLDMRYLARCRNGPAGKHPRPFIAQKRFLRSDLHGKLRISKPGRLNKSKASYTNDIITRSIYQTHRTTVVDALL